MRSFPGGVRGNCAVAVAMLIVHRVVVAVVPVAAWLAILVAVAGPLTDAFVFACVRCEGANTGSGGVGDPD